ncbi:MAG: hypothetical protein LBT47_08080 [Deltaproteobacteria bacterium]|jgi:cell fate regulator YaaT (PSP1 superfamily)|nr:hypothetical protein [Deltaproteobacteria bacterium]
MDSDTDKFPEKPGKSKNPDFTRRGLKIKREELPPVVNLPCQRTVNVRLKFGGRIMAYDCDNLVLDIGDWVVIKDAEILRMGLVCSKPIIWPADQEKRQICLPSNRRLLRAATNSDLARQAENQLKERDAFDYCQSCITNQNLPMNLVATEVTFDNFKTIFYYTSDERVDFRQLVRELVSRLRTRIEMRQIGVRNEAMLVGGMGICGRPFCCAGFLNFFSPVSVKMAKDQNVSLNTTKLSGVCGRLMCCLAFENYEDPVTRTYDDADSATEPEEQAAFRGQGARASESSSAEKHDSQPGRTAKPVPKNWRGRFSSPGKENAAPHDSSSQPSVPGNRLSTPKQSRNAADISSTPPSCEPPQLISHPEAKEDSQPAVVISSPDQRPSKSGPEGPSQPAAVISSPDQTPTKSGPEGPSQPAAVISSLDQEPINPPEITEPPRSVAADEVTQPSKPKKALPVLELPPGPSPVEIIVEALTTAAKAPSWSGLLYPPPSEAPDQEEVLNNNSPPSEAEQFPGPTEFRTNSDDDFYGLNSPSTNASDAGQSVFHGRDQAGYDYQPSFGGSYVTAGDNNDPEGQDQPESGALAVSNDSSGLGQTSTTAEPDLVEPVVVTNYLTELAEVAWSNADSVVTTLPSASVRSEWVEGLDYKIEDDDSETDSNEKTPSSADDSIEASQKSEEASDQASEKNSSSPEPGYDGEN